jgi:hypothetical protein
MTVATPATGTTDTSSVEEAHDHGEREQHGEPNKDKLIRVVGMLNPAGR